MAWPNLSFTTWVDAVDTYSASILNAIQDALVAMQSDILAGWLVSPWAWTYVSATTFTVAGDRTATFHKGTKLKWTQTTVKYAYVVSSSYSAGTGLTTITITGGSDYSIANAAITSPYYSYAENPQGFPQWFAYTATTTGFTADTPAHVAAFRISGRTCAFVFAQTAAAASDATDFTVSLPVAAATRAAAEWGSFGRGYDNSAVSSVFAHVLSAGTTAILTRGAAIWNDAGWTAANNKSASFSVTYEI